MYVRSALLTFISYPIVQTETRTSLVCAVPSMNMNCIGANSLSFNGALGYINSCNNVGETALLLAIRLQKRDIAELLIIRGAEVNVVDKDGWSPLHRAAEAGDVEVCNSLVAKQALVNCQNKAGAVYTVHAFHSLVQTLPSDNISFPCKVRPDPTPIRILFLLVHV
jgi:hypothetical protein